MSLRMRVLRFVLRAGALVVAFVCFGLAYDLGMGLAPQAAREWPSAMAEQVEMGVGLLMVPLLLVAGAAAMAGVLLRRRGLLRVGALSYGVTFGAILVNALIDAATRPADALPASVPGFGEVLFAVVLPIAVLLLAGWTHPRGESRRLRWPDLRAGFADARQRLDALAEEKA